MRVNRRRIRFKSMIDALKRNIPRIIMCLTVVACMVILVSDFVTGKKFYDVQRGKVVDIRGGVENIELLEAMTDGTRYEQTFRSEYDLITEISLMFSEYAGGDPVMLDIVLSDVDTGIQLDDWHTDTTKLREYGFLYLVCDNYGTQESVRNHTCKITVEVSGILPGDGFGCYARTNDVYNNGELFVDGQALDKDLVMTIYGHKDIRDLRGVRLWLCIYLLLIAYLLVKLVGRKRSE